MPIRYRKHGHVRLITIDRRAKMNSLDFAANAALVEAWRRFERDDDARVAVVTGAGNQAFCAGADLKTYTMAFARRPGPEFRRRYTNGPGFGGITRGMELWKPVIAAINGYAMSGGLELALACDLRLCSPNAQFALQDVQWGFHACDGALIRLPWIVGLGNAMELFLTGDRIDAGHALRIGLVNRIVPQQKLLAEAMACAQKLAQRAPLPQQLGKEVMLRSLGRAFEDGLRFESRSFHDLAFSADLKAGTAAFRRKRAAKFKGR